MMVRVAVLASIVAIAASGQSGETRDQSHQPGAMPPVFSTIFAQLPTGTHICATYVYPTFSGSTQVALLTATERLGWGVRIYDYNSKTGEIGLHWQSGKLPPEFGVSSAAHFRLVGADILHDGEDIEFSGCMQHDCPESYAVLVYSPSRHRAFHAIITQGKTRFSPELEKPENKVVKDYLSARLLKMQEDYRGS